LSHRRKSKILARFRSQTRCKHCGSTDIMFGKKSSLCKNCRTVAPRPRRGWRDENGKHIKFQTYQCGGCGRLYGASTRNERLDCPHCGSTERTVVECW